MYAGRWTKGQSGNPGGRPKEDARLRELARERTEMALDTLTAIMSDEKAPAAARVSAACAILDRGFGRPAQQLQHSGLSSVGDLASELDAARRRVRIAELEAKRHAQEAIGSTD